MQRSAIPHAPTTRGSGALRLVAAACVVLFGHALAARAQNGPVVNFIGLATAFGSPIPPTGANDLGPIFERGSGSGFVIVIEGRLGASQQPVGTSTYNAADPTMFPDLQIQVDQVLGNGSSAVCDDTPPLAGGVMRIPLPDFTETSDNAFAMNDFACRFVDSLGRKMGRGFDDPCTTPAGNYGFIRASSTIQFCATVSPTIQFGLGRTQVSVRLRDIDGVVGPVAYMFVQVGALPSPSRTATLGTPATPTKTPTIIPSPISSPTATGPATPLHTSTIPPAPSPTHTAVPTGTPASTPTVTATPTSTSSPRAVANTPTPTPTERIARIDIDTLIRAIYASTPPPEADVNGDGRVTAADLPALISLP